MTPMPKAAQVIAQVIREKVERPKRLPKLIGMLHGISLRFRRNKQHICPMALLLTSKMSSPAYLCDFSNPPGSLKQIQAFYRWWDRQRDPQQAVDAVWGKFLNE